MNYRIKGFLIVLFVLKAIVSTQSAELSFEHDVTKHVDGWIAKIFKVNSDTAKKLFSRISQVKEISDFAVDIGHEVKPLGEKFLFHNVYMNLSEFKSPQINWKFSESKMGIFIKEFTIRIMGTIRESSDTEYTKFDTHLDLENVTFTLSVNSEDKTSQEFTFDHSWLWFCDDVNVYFTGDNDLTMSKRKELEKELLPVLPALVRENFKRNEDFPKGLRMIFKTYSAPRKNLISMHSDFFTNNENKYYYLIPKIPFFCFNLKNVFIKGLWNLEWIKINTGLSIFTHTLMIRNIQGSLVLDFGTPHEKPVDLQFKIDYFSVSIDRKSVNVDARCYSVNKTNTPLSYRQSALIMQRIESAVANSLLPSLAVRRTYDIDTPVEQIKITEKTDWKTIKTSFGDWIPFNEDGKPPPPAGGAGAGVKT